jgi:hypothetical protein
MGMKIKVNKNNTEIIKSIYDYRMQARMRLIEEKVNKLYRFGLTFWAVLAIILLFFALLAMF